MQPSIFQTAKLACHDAASAALAAPALFALMWVAQFGTNRLDALVVPGGPRTLSLTLAAWTILSVLIGGLATTLMAVFIHRRIILGERSSFASLVVRRRTLATFYVASAVVGLLMIIATFAFGLTISAKPSLPVGLGVFVFWCVGIYLALRLALLFPAIAVDDEKRDVVTAFRRSKGLVWRLCFSAILIMLPCAAAIWLFGMAADQTASLAAPLKAAALAAEQTFVLAVTVAIASRFYLMRIAA